VKKSLLITAGIILILIILGVWGYLLLFGSPKGSSEVFANLGFGSPTEITFDTNSPDDSPQSTDDQADVSEKALRQLTLKPVAGFGFLGTDSTKVRYVERGVGHIFEIDLITGNETRVSATTIPLVTEAIFSPSGDSVALMTQVGYERNLYVGEINRGSDQTEFTELNGSAFDPHFENDTSMKVALNTEAGTDGYRFDLTDESLTKLFSLPLGDVRMIWHNQDVFTYPKPSNKLQGALYKVSQNRLAPITESVYSFSGDTNGQKIIYSNIESNQYNSYVKEIDSDETFVLPSLFIPEKCSRLRPDGESVWCANDVAGTYSADSIDAWYKGSLNYNDYLWRIDLDDQSSTLYSDMQGESGRQIDVSGLLTDNFDEKLLFKNKIDNTLWLYDSTIQ
jgi:hypothetical protein